MIEYKVILAELEQIKHRLDVIEGLEPKADAVQPLVGPPDVVGAAGPAALARPATLSEIETWVRNEFKDLRIVFAQGTIVARHFDLAEDAILKRLGKLDQGTAAQCHAEDEVQKRAWHPNSEHSH